MTCRSPVVLLALFSLFLSAATPSEAGRRGRHALATIEGVVLEIEELEGEGGLQTLAIVLDLDGSERGRRVLLAPQPACQEIGFEVEEGDRIRTRIFVSDEGPDKAQKALNLTRGTMVRLRTLRSIPLWTQTGAWRGAPSRSRPGADGARSPAHRPVAGSRPAGPPA